MWFVFASISGLFSAASGLISRRLLKGSKDSWAYSFYYSLIGAVVSLPFMITSFKVAHSYYLWIILFVVGVLIVLQNFLIFKSTNFLEPSVQGIITKFRLVWVFVFGIFILGETFSYMKFVGTILTLVAGAILVHKFKKKQSVQGIILAFSSTLFYAAVIILYKFLFKEFNSSSLTFFIFIIPAAINLIIMPSSIKRVSVMIKESTWPVIISCALGAFTNLTMNYALTLGEASKVLVIMEAFLIVTLVGEHLILKEKDHLWTKIIAILIVILGALLIRLS
jgi:drug/metabolite transporter (DMT)-like permease